MGTHEILGGRRKGASGLNGLAKLVGKLEAASGKVIPVEKSEVPTAPTELIQSATEAPQPQPNQPEINVNAATSPRAVDSRREEAEKIGIANSVVQTNVAPSGTKRDASGEVGVLPEKPLDFSVVTAQDHYVSVQAHEAKLSEALAQASEHLQAKVAELVHVREAHVAELELVRQKTQGVIDAEVGERIAAVETRFALQLEEARAALQAALERAEAADHALAAERQARLRAEGGRDVVIGEKSGLLADVSDISAQLEIARAKLVSAEEEVVRVRTKVAQGEAKHGREAWQRRTEIAKQVSPEIGRQQREGKRAESIQQYEKLAEKWVAQVRGNVLSWLGPEVPKEMQFGTVGEFQRKRDVLYKALAKKVITAAGAQQLKKTFDALRESMGKVQMGLDGAGADAYSELAGVQLQYISEMFAHLRAIERSNNAATIARQRAHLDALGAQLERAKKFNDIAAKARQAEADTQRANTNLAAHIVARADAEKKLAEEAAARAAAEAQLKVVAEVADAQRATEEAQKREVAEAEERRKEVEEVALENSAEDYNKRRDAVLARRADRKNMWAERQAFETEKSANLRLQVQKAEATQKALEQARREGEMSAKREELRILDGEIVQELNEQLVDMRETVAMIQKAPALRTIRFFSEDFLVNPRGENPEDYYKSRYKMFISALHHLATELQLQGREFLEIRTQAASLRTFYVAEDRSLRRMFKRRSELRQVLNVNSGADSSV